MKTLVDLPGIPGCVSSTSSVQAPRDHAAALRALAEASEQITETLERELKR